MRGSSPARKNMSASREDETASADPRRSSLPAMHPNSLPSTPKQRPRQMSFISRSKSRSPPRGNGSHSPRSISSESNRVLPSLRPTNPSCRYQSTRTSTRRMPYSIGADMLDLAGSSIPKELPPGSVNSLQSLLRTRYQVLRPSQESTETRRKVVEKLQKILQDEWPERQVKVFVFGSSGNLLYTNDSDGMCSVTQMSIPAPFLTRQ